VQAVYGAATVDLAQTFGHPAIALVELVSKFDQL
jgi:hypothetical protein